jgi:hypothetical protein
MMKIECFTMKARWSHRTLMHLTYPLFPPILKLIVV